MARGPARENGSRKNARIRAQNSNINVT